MPNSRLYGSPIAIAILCHTIVWAVAIPFSFAEEAAGLMQKHRRRLRNNIIWPNSIKNPLAHIQTLGISSFTKTVSLRLSVAEELFRLCYDAIVLSSTTTKCHHYAIVVRHRCRNECLYPLPSHGFFLPSCS